MTSAQFPVLVYGTLRPNGGNYESFLEGNTVQERDVRLHGFLMLAGGGYPYLLRGDQEVTCTLIHLDPVKYAQVLQRLDFLEGFHGDNYSHNHYDRILHAFELDGKTIQAWVYVASTRSAKDAQKRLPVLENGDWIAHVNSKRLSHSW